MTGDTFDEEVMTQGIQQALAQQTGIHADPGAIAAAIASTAVDKEEPMHQFLVSFSQLEKTTYRFDLVKALLAAAGLLGAGIGAVVGAAGAPGLTAQLAAPQIAAALSALAALGALKGLKEPLPKTCAQVVLLLLPAKRSARQELAAKFAAAFEGPPSLAEYELEKALELLQHVGSVKISEGSVRLRERVIFRR